jgi:folate-dependent phosphoribosylglycinamide formyltransferase PurN
VTHAMQPRPSIVLLCHDDDVIDREGLAAWLASSMQLAGIVEIREARNRKWLAARRERRRTGWMGLADALAFRALYRLTAAAADRQWCEREAARLKNRYPADVQGVPRITVSSPNSESARQFIAARQPDLILARCKFILAPRIFSLARHGTFVMHPGICPEYRNAHGCFWALAERDLGRVGMTLLRVDAGIDTGPAFLRAGYDYDEQRESHVVIQYRSVIENLDVIARVLLDVCRGAVVPLEDEGRRSAAWGHPRLSAYLRWKRAAKRSRHDARDLPALS